MVEPPYNYGDDTADLDRTQPGVPPPRRPTDRFPPPPPGGGHVRPRGPERARDRRDRKAEKRKPDHSTATMSDDQIAAARRARHRVTRPRRDSGLYLPAWSVVAMLIVVFGVAAGIILIVYTLGGNASPGGEPRVIIVSAVPSPTIVGAPQAAVNSTLDPNATAGPMPTFALEGPILPTVFISPTPPRISIGQTVQVINVGTDGLNVRTQPGLSGEVQFRAAEGDTFLVIDGPQTADGLTWWRIRVSDNAQRLGWAVENTGDIDVLQVVTGQ